MRVLPRHFAALPLRAPACSIALAGTLQTPQLESEAWVFGDEAPERYRPRRAAGAAAGTACARERRTEYEKVAQVLTKAQAGGIGKIGFITDPQPE